MAGEHTHSASPLKSSRAQTHAFSTSRTLYISIHCISSRARRLRVRLSVHVGNCNGRTHKTMARSQAIEGRAHYHNAGTE